MQGALAPDHEVTVSAELRHLLSLAGRPHKPRPDPAPDVFAAPATGSACRDRLDAAPSAPTVDVLLRRDGGRPLKLSGLTLVDAGVEGPEGSARLRVFLTDDGRAVAQIAYLPAETLPARPVFRTVRIGSAEDLHRFVSETGPALCFGAMVPRHQDHARHTARAGLALPDFLPGLTRLRRTSPHSREGQHP
jgi:hypothetical protein